MEGKTTRKTYLVVYDYADGKHVFSSVVDVDSIESAIKKFSDVDYRVLSVILLNSNFNKIFNEDWKVANKIQTDLRNQIAQNEGSYERPDGNK